MSEGFKPEKERGGGLFSHSRAEVLLVGTKLSGRGEGNTSFVKETGPRAHPQTRTFFLPAGETWITSLRRRRALKGTGIKITKMQSQEKRIRISLNNPKERGKIVSGRKGLCWRFARKGGEHNLQNRNPAEGGSSQGGIPSLK